jgi:2-iminobutanoate/2-iminopropanoate deaminase
MAPDGAIVPAWSVRSGQFGSRQSIRFSGMPAAGEARRGENAVFRKVGFALLIATLVAGCGGKGFTIFGHPLVYDPAADSNDKKGAATADSRGKPPDKAAAKPASDREPVAQGGVLSSVPRPAWASQTDTVAPQTERAAPQAETVASAAPTSRIPAAARAAAELGIVAPARVAPARNYGGMVFLSGQVAVDPRTGHLTADRSIEGQTRQVMENIRATLDANRLTMANIVSVTVMISNMDNLPAADRVYASFFNGELPARSVLEASRLPNGALVEISAVAGR